MIRRLLVFIYALAFAFGLAPTATAQLVPPVKAAVTYYGTWNASTNTPTIPAASTQNKGYYYKVTVAGSTNVGGITTWNVGDWVVSDGTSWGRIAGGSTSGAVTSVAGRTGAVTLSAPDVGLANLVNSLQVINGGNVASATFGTHASRPSAGTAGRLYIESDTYAIFYDNGTAWNQVANNTIVVTGLDWTGATDSTAAIDAAKAALPANGGKLVFPPAPSSGNYFKANEIADKDGVEYIGPGRAKQGTGSFWRPYDNTKPAFQFAPSAGTTVVRAITLRDFAFDGGGAGQYGVKVQGGSQHNHVTNVDIWNFTQRGLWVTHTDNQPTVYNHFTDICVESSTPGANGAVFEDPHVAGGGYTGATFVTNLSTQVSSGAPVGSETYGGQPLVMDSISGTLFMANAYIQMSNSAQGFLIKKTWNGYPQIAMSGVNFDNSAGASAINIQVDTAYDLWAPSATAGMGHPFEGISGASTNGGKTYFVAGHTTGTISLGTPTTLTVASATGINADRTIVVLGAGPSGKPLVSTIASISGTTITLNTAASTAVTSADTQYGNVAGEMAMKPDHAAPFLTTTGIYLGNAQKSRLESGANKGQLYHTAAVGPIYPWNATNFVFDMGSQDFNIFQDNGSSGTPTSLVRSGTTVTVTMPGSHNTGTGQYITVDGANEAGFNGTFLVASVPSGTTLTYTSPISASTTATGTINVRFDSNVKFRSNGLILSHRGLYMLDQNGVETRIFSQSTTNSNFNISTPNTTTGQIIITTGNTQSATNHALGIFAGTAGSNSEVSFFNAQGNLYLIKSSTPSTNAAGGFIFTDTNGNLNAWSAAGTQTLLSLDKTITGAGTTGAQTINKPMGTVRFAAGAGTGGLVVTNSLVTTNSVIICTVGSNDTTLKSVVAVAASGSFTLTANANATAETIVYFRVYN